VKAATLKVMVVVEDDDGMRLLIRRTLMGEAALELAGEASTASEAIEEAKTLHPDLVILDHFIEGDVMGLEAAPKIHDAAPHAKILLFSDHDLASESEREPAIDAFLPKRRLSELLPTVRQLLGLDGTR
jgi:DNA-binding NarL/FixJ family response regulator